MIIVVVLLFCCCLILFLIGSLVSCDSHVTCSCVHVTACDVNGCFFDCNNNVNNNFFSRHML